MQFSNLSPIFFGLLYLVIAEIGLEYRAHSRGYETLLFQIEQRSGEKPVHTSENTNREQASVFPFRSPVVTAEKEENERRILISSASHAEDSYLPVEKIFPTRLATNLQRFGSLVNVLNASRAGIGITSNIDDLEQIGQRYNSDISILYQMSTEISRMSKQDVSQKTPDQDNRTSQEEHRSFWDFAPRFFEQTTLYTLIKTNLTTRLSECRNLPDSLPGEAHSEFKQLVRRYIKSSQAQGMTPVLCTFAASSSSVSQFPRDHWYAILRTTPKLSKQGWLSTINEWNESLRALAQQHDLALIDLSDECTGKRELFRDFVHFSEEGHSRVAQVIADELIEAGLVSSKDSTQEAN